MTKNMPSMKGKMRKEDESDSDESFHCCGRPEDLLEDAQSLMETVEPHANEIHVPDDQDYYLYSAGLQRLNSSPSGSNAPKRQSLSSIDQCQRAPSICSSDSDSTRIGSPLLIIKTGKIILPSSFPEMSHLRFELVHSHIPASTKPRRKPRWKIHIPRPQSFIRMAISPTSTDTHSPQTPQPLTALHASTALLNPPTGTPSPASRRRRGMIFNPNCLPEELKEFAKSHGSDQN